MQEEDGWFAHLCPNLLWSSKAQKLKIVTDHHRNSHDHHLVITQITGPPMLMSKQVLHSLLEYSEISKSLISKEKLFSTPAIKSALTVAWELHVLPEIWCRFRQYSCFLISFLCFLLCAGQEERYFWGMFFGLACLAMSYLRAKAS